MGSVLGGVGVSEVVFGGLVAVEAAPFEEVVPFLVWRPLKLRLISRIFGLITLKTTYGERTRTRPITAFVIFCFAFVFFEILSALLKNMNTAQAICITAKNAAAPMLSRYRLFINAGSESEEADTLLSPGRLVSG